jgi:hypothetical protein
VEGHEERPSRAGVSKGFWGRANVRPALFRVTLETPKALLNVRVAADNHIASQNQEIVRAKALVGKSGSEVFGLIGADFSRSEQFESNILVGPSSRIESSSPCSTHR